MKFLQAFFKIKSNSEQNFRFSSELIHTFTPN